VCAGVPVLHVRGNVLLLAPHAQAVPPHAPPQAGTGEITSCTVLYCLGQCCGSGYWPLGSESVNSESRIRIHILPYYLKKMKKKVSNFTFFYD
jgi:hypothetical protein